MIHVFFYDNAKVKEPNNIREYRHMAELDTNDLEEAFVKSQNDSYESDNGWCPSGKARSSMVGDIFVRANDPQVGPYEHFMVAANSFVKVDNIYGWTMHWIEETVCSGKFTKLTTEIVMRRWPRLTAHVICESLGYATPSCAARIIFNHKMGQPDFCEWIYSCHHGDPTPVVKSAFRDRRTHHGFMAEYRQAKALVEEALKSGREPDFASWF